MSDGTLETLISSKTKKSQSGAIDDPLQLASENLITHTVKDFIAQCEFARTQGSDWVETTAEVIKHFNPHGLGGGLPYFIYRGVKVCEHGKSEDIQKELDKTYYLSNEFTQGRIEVIK